MTRWSLNRRFLKEVICIYWASTCICWLLGWRCDKTNSIWDNEVISLGRRICTRLIRMGYPWFRIQNCYSSEAQWRSCATDLTWEVWDCAIVMFHQRDVFVDCATVVFIAKFSNRIIRRTCGHTRDEASSRIFSLRSYGDCSRLHTTMIESARSFFKLACMQYFGVFCPTLASSQVHSA